MQRSGSGPSMYGCSGVDGGDGLDGTAARPMVLQLATGGGDARSRSGCPAGRPARLILNIDHVYSTQRDSLVITISTTGQHGPLASSIVPDQPTARVRPCRGPSRPSPAPLPPARAPAHRSRCQLVGSPPPPLTLYQSDRPTLAGSFVISSNGFRALVRRRRSIEFDESLKLTAAVAAACDGRGPRCVRRHCMGGPFVRRL